MAHLIHRIVIMVGFLFALIIFFYKIWTGADLLISAFYALCVMFAVSTVFLIAIQSVAQILFKYLREKKMEMHREMMRKREEEREKRRQKQKEQAEKQQQQQQQKQSA